MRVKNPPKFKFYQNKYDAYLTKTQKQLINFSDHKKRQLRIIKNDLYTQTEGRGIPQLQRVEIRNNKMINSPSFFKESTTEINKATSKVTDSQSKIDLVASLKFQLSDASFNILNSQNASLQSLK